MDGYIYFRDEDSCEHSIDKYAYNSLHWSLKQERFDQKLNDWKDFRKDQQRIYKIQQINGATKINKPQHRERQFRAFTLEEQKASELEWDRHEQELEDWKESRDAQRRADQNQKGKGADREVNLQQHELEQESRFTTSLTLLKN